ncbi:HK97 gp10 family phage protein [Caproiciproducens sp. NJN-50]|uniref:HK97 gp10 family phage protein n=1 Tax=Caproiciproducens sp. NJN-50 TaxID=2507162 RepID=UPI000FFE309F|nr:HK97 gp10 family phage protein [Caproiciproducens sp. NJN-50]QAT48586.1 HK97 gp10 family phage protein [Caproiciproducens sp. NJN-50]
MSVIGFQQYMEQLKQLGADLDDSAQRVLSQMNAKAMAETIKQTPVGKYPKGSGKVGGTLRKGWINGGTHKVGNGHESKYHNSVYYSLYVNNGHRIVSKKGETTGWVDGIRMLEYGQNSAQESAQSIFNKEIQRVKKKGGW